VFTLFSIIYIKKHIFHLQQPALLGYYMNSILGCTGYGLDGPGIESQWERDFSAHV